MATNTNGRKRNLTGSRPASSISQAYHEGQEASLNGVAETDCPYIDKQKHAAWRTGWSDMKIRVRTNPAIRGAATPTGAKYSRVGVRQAMERLWPRLSRAEQEHLVDWVIAHMREVRPVSTSHRR